MVEIVDFDASWDEKIAGLPGSHLLQTFEWGQIKARVGWKAAPMIWRDENKSIQAAALVLTRSMRLLKVGPKISVCYIPRGPMLDWSNSALRGQVFNDLLAFARRQKALFIKIDPELKLGFGIPGAEGSSEDPVGQIVIQEMQNSGWRFSSSQVQFRNTVLLDLNGNEEDWLQRMKQKTRYNMRLAQRSGVTVRAADESELPLIYKMYAETSVRDGFVIRSEEYYQDVWQRFMHAEKMTPMVAEFEGQMIAGLMLFYYGKNAWYLHGMSTGQHREKMPNYLLQWEAMRLAKAKGCEIYDLWGAPDVFDGKDSMTGVFRFKEGLGGKVLRTCGAWDFVLQPLGFFLYQQVLPRILALLRRARKQQTGQELSD